MISTLARMPSVPSPSPLRLAVDPPRHPWSSPFTYPVEVGGQVRNPSRSRADFQGDMLASHVNPIYAAPTRTIVKVAHRAQSGEPPPTEKKKKVGGAALRPGQVHPAIARERSSPRRLATARRTPIYAQDLLPAFMLNSQTGGRLRAARFSAPHRAVLDKEAFKGGRLYPNKPPAPFQSMSYTRSSSPRDGSGTSPLGSRWPSSAHVTGSSRGSPPNDGLLMNQAGTRPTNYKPACEALHTGGPEASKQQSVTPTGIISWGATDPKGLVEGADPAHMVDPHLQPTNVITTPISSF